MWIILEGVDGSGKSTLQETVLKRLRDDNATAVGTHMSPPRDEFSALAEVVDELPFGTYQPAGPVSLVSDRHHGGCPIYGPIYRPHLDKDGWGDMGQSGFRYAELFLASRGAVTFLISVEPQTARDRIGIRGDDYIDVAHLEGLCDKYADLRNDMVTYASTFHELSREELRTYADIMIDIAAARESHASRVDMPADYIGVLEPKALVTYNGQRETALEILSNLDSDQWRSVGLIGPSHSYEELRMIRQRLGDPHLGTIGTQHLDACALAYQTLGTITDDVADVGRMV